MRKNRKTLFRLNAETGLKNGVLIISLFENFLPNNDLFFFVPEKRPLFWFLFSNTGVKLVSKETSLMPRALGGAPTLPGLPLPLAWARGLWTARFLLVIVRVRRSYGLRGVGTAQTTASSPDTFLQAKNKIFQEVRPLSRL